MIDKERINFIRQSACSAGLGGRIAMGAVEAVFILDLAIKVLEAGSGVPKDIVGLIEALGHQKQCDEDGVECIVSRQAVDEAITILKGLEQPDAIIGCALEQVLQAADTERLRLSELYKADPSNERWFRLEGSVKVVDAIRSLNEPALKAWELVKAKQIPDGYEIVPRKLTPAIREAMLLCESGRFSVGEAWTMLLVSAIDAERAKA